MEFVPYTKNSVSPNDWGVLKHAGKTLCKDIQRKNADVIIEVKKTKAELLKACEAAYAYLTNTLNFSLDDKDNIAKKLKRAIKKENQ